MKLKLWHWLLLALLLFGAGVVVAKTLWPSIVEPPPEVRYVDRPITRRDTITVVRPETRTIYQTVHDLRVDTVYLPVSFEGVGVISASPIRFERGNIVLTYFGLSDTAFVQDRFRIPRPTTSYYLAAVTGIDPLDRKLTFGFEAAARWRRFTVFGRAETSLANQNLMFGIRFRFYGIE